MLRATGTQMHQSKLTTTPWGCPAHLAGTWPGSQSHKLTAALKPSAHGCSRQAERGGLELCRQHPCLTCNTGTMAALTTACGQHTSCKRHDNRPVQQHAGPDLHQAGNRQRQQKCHSLAFSTGPARNELASCQTGTHCTACEQPALTWPPDQLQAPQQWARPAAGWTLS